MCIRDSYTTDGGKSQDRSLLPSPAALFPLPTTSPTGASPTNGYFNLLPQFQFGTVSGGSAMNFTRSGTTAGNYENFNPIWTFADNLSKVVGKHSFKFGGYPVSYTHLRAHETRHDLVCRLLLEKKKK